MSKAPVKRIHEFQTKDGDKVYAVILTPGELWFFRGIMGKTNGYGLSEPAAERQSDLFVQFATVNEEAVHMQDAQARDIDLIKIESTELRELLDKEAEEGLLETDT